MHTSRAVIALAGASRIAGQRNKMIRRISNIRIKSALDHAAYPAVFVEVRRSHGAKLGWATVKWLDDIHSGAFSHTIPAIVVPRAWGLYTVYTVSDWQAAYYDDLADPEDYRYLLSTQTFVNPARRDSEPATALARSFLLA
jgi:hypothetical protein